MRFSDLIHQAGVALALFRGLVRCSSNNLWTELSIRYDRSKKIGFPWTRNSSGNECHDELDRAVNAEPLLPCRFEYVRKCHNAWHR